MSGTANPSVEVQDDEAACCGVAVETFSPYGTRSLSASCGQAEEALGASRTREDSYAIPIFR
jgi:hypothetical protein